MGDGVRALPLSDAHESLCAALGETIDNCDERADEAGTVENCEDYVRGLSDNYAEALEECMSESCDEIEECLATTADDFDTDTLDLAEIVSPDLRRTCAERDASALSMSRVSGRRASDRLPPHDRGHAIRR